MRNRERERNMKELEYAGFGDILGTGSEKLLGLGILKSLT